MLGGLGLLAAFPLAFAIIIPAVYFPVLMMLLALISVSYTHLTLPTILRV